MPVYIAFSPLVDLVDRGLLAPVLTFLAGHILDYRHQFVNFRTLVSIGRPAFACSAFTNQNWRSP